MINEPVNQRHMSDNPGASARMTTQSLPPGLAAKTAERTSLGHRFQRALTGGPNRRLPGLHPSPGGAASLSPFLNRRLGFPIFAILALLAASLLFLLPGGLAHGQDDGPIEYAENRMDAVATFTATDPENRMVYWSLLAINATGTPEDIEPSTDSAEVAHFSISANGVLSFNFLPDYEAPPETNVDAPNTYRVVVVAADEPLGATNRVLGYEKVTVMVTDEDEPGMVTLSAQKPQVSVLLTATLTDDDATDEQITAAEWMWEHSSAANGPWTPIPTATTAAYMPLGVVDKYLRVTATYDDRHGSDKSSVPAVSANMVRAVPDAANANPTFPTGSDARSVDENSAPDTNVGARVAANDVSGDTLTYTFSGGTNDSSYSINAATGQITVGARTELNHEEDETHTVNVTATDPAGGATQQIVTITINDVNEVPMISEGFTRNSQEEYDADDETGDTGVDTAKTVDTYMADDVDQTEAVSWSVSGTDAGDFDISTGGVLTFKEAPNYEMPADSNRDNVYMVTVVATDAGVDSKNKMTAERAVVITITNVDEDGTVTLSSEQPKIGIELTAMLEDPDGVVADSVKWTWHSSNDGSGAAIAMATSDTYTPEATGTLSAKATYTDGHGANKEAVGPAANDVVVNLANVAPKFPDTETGMRGVEENTAAGTAINDAADDTEADPVEATDANTDDTLTYTLSGTDMASFDIVRSSGQLQTKAKLDYETKKSYMVKVTATDPDGLKASIDVTITVTDMDEAPMIAGDDIAEDFRENGSNLQIERFRATDPERRPVYWSLAAEAVTDVATADDIADHPHFMINSDGVLSFKFSPDYEMPRGLASEANNTNTYKVVVVASDDPTGAGTDGAQAGIKMGYKKVTVNVTNVDETETITLSAERAQVNVELTATYNDADNEMPAGATLMWKWYLGNSEIPGAITAAYTPASRGSLRVEASYTKTDGTIKRVSKTISVRAVPDAANANPTFPTGSDARSVDENSAPDTNVGARVAANDASGDTLTYTFSGGANDSSYSINAATGQITVGARTELNHEEDETHTVNVTATDPAGGATQQIVTITINDVNEVPMISEGFTRNSQEEYDADDETGDTGVDTAKTVDTYMADDVDQTEAVSWSVSGTDAGDFDISTGGVLTFKEAPNYEMPADSNRDNVYMVTVVATDAGVDSKNKMTAERAVVITITNVDEDGTVTLSSEQPKIGIELTAMLEDPDGVVADSVKWTWHSSNDGSGAAIAMATSDTYTPEATGTLSAKATYTDGHGANKEAVGPAANDVVVNLANVAPKFPDTETGARSVAEGTAAGQNINISATEDNTADPDLDLVRATDANDDTLTYTLGGTDMASFDIVRASGQLQTKAKLDYEDKKSYMVTVTATDPDGLKASIDVTIMVTDVDEAPEIMLGGLAISGPSSPDDYAENGTGMVADYDAVGPDAASARWSLEGDDASDFTLMNGTLKFKRSPNYEMPMDSGTDNVYMVTVKAMDGTYTAMKPVTVTVTNVDEIGTLSGPETVSNYMEDSEDAVGTYTVSGGSMSEMANLTLMGDDDGDFRIMDDGMLKFRSSPDFENPMDSDTDNEYMVTVKAEAGGETEMRPVTVTVTNKEEPGRVTFWRDGADATTAVIVVGDELGGAVEDSDGNPGDTFPIAMYRSIANVTSWQWARSMDMTDWEDIGTGGMYTVMDDDAGHYLRATATYDDGEGMGKMASKKTMMVIMNASPMFDAETGTREVAENTAADMDIGDPVTATDADDDTLTYTLSGADMDSFDIDDTTGQLMTKADLDYETKMTYTVMVTATDPDGESDSITVTITVTDVEENQAPMFPGAEATRNIAENTPAGVNIGQPVTATDADDDTLTYTLGGADAASFDIDPTSGQLMTKAALDRETKSTYTVTVTASDGNGGEAVATVTIEVTDVDENRPPKFEFNTLTRSIAENTAAGVNIGQPVTATDADDDTLTYELGGVDMADFDIEATSGQLMTKAMLDYETKNTYTVTVAAMDGNGGRDDVTVTISVTDVGLDTPYDADDSGDIDKAEVLKAINDYLFEDAIGKADVLRLINIYLFGS